MPVLTSVQPLLASARQRGWRFWAAVGAACLLALMVLSGGGSSSPSAPTPMVLRGTGPDDAYTDEDPGNVRPDVESAEEVKAPKEIKDAIAADGKQCSAKMHFLPYNKQRKHPVALASFPGSGNTWVRFLVEQGTRVYTGSVYHDMDLNQTYPGEGLDDVQVIAVKTHYPCPNCWTYQRCAVCAGGLPVTAPMTGPVTDADAAVFILRSPFDALLAEFNRIRTGKHAGELQPEDFRKVPKRKPYETAFDQPSWNDFINQRLVAYAKAARTYLDHATEARSPSELKRETGADPDASESGSLTPAEIEKRKAVFERSERFVSKGGKLVKLVFYERLKKDPQAEMEKVFAFLRDLYEAEGIKDAIITPPSAAAKCAMDHYRAAAANHFVWQRAHTKRFNPWTAAQIKKVCTDLGKWWFASVWGECMEGKLQWEREQQQQATGAGA